MPQPRFVDRLDLAATPTAVNCSRVFTKLTLTKWGASSMVDDALLVVSELVTTAIHATGNTELHPRYSELDHLNLVRVSLVGLERSIVVEVWDSDPQLPAMQGDGLNAESGGGLRLVADVAERWGSYPTTHGKVVWAELAVYPQRETSIEQSQKTLPPLPRRTRKSFPEPGKPVEIERDPEVLRQVLEGLHRLGEDGA